MEQQNLKGGTIIFYKAAFLKTRIIKDFLIGGTYKR